MAQWAICTTDWKKLHTSKVWCYDATDRSEDKLAEQSQNYRILRAKIKDMLMKIKQKGKDTPIRCILRHEEILKTATEKMAKKTRIIVHVGLEGV